MPITIILIKIILVLWSAIIIGNYFRTLYWALISSYNLNDIDTEFFDKSKSLLMLGGFSIWISATSVYFGEHLLIGKSTGYSATLMYVIGILFLIVTIVSAISTVLVAWSRNKQNHSCLPILKKIVKFSFVLTIVCGSSVWAIS